MRLSVAVFVLCLVALTSLAVVATSSAQQRYGTIRGTVSDRQGSAVAHAKVTAESLCLTPWVKRMLLDQTESDDQGRYEFKRLQYGRYSISAEKPDENYPPLYLHFYSPEKQPEVDVSEANENVTLDLVLRIKAGVLVGTVADSETGTPMDDKPTQRNPRQIGAHRNSVQHLPLVRRCQFSCLTISFDLRAKG